jgi:hypothetical protein
LYVESKEGPGVSRLVLKDVRGRPLMNNVLSTIVSIYGGCIILPAMKTRPVGIGLSAGCWMAARLTGMTRATKVSMNVL